jgi:spoIIIJ-associated protein
MNEGIFEGKTLDEALLKASQEMGANISDMEYEILEQDSGLLGFFKKNVKIKVILKEGAGTIVYRNGQKVLAKSEETKMEVAKRLLSGIMERMGVNAQLSATEGEDAIKINIQTEDGDLIIGREGDVLNALQFIVNKVVNREAEGRKLVMLDAVGFRDKRGEELASVARNLAEKAIRQRRIVRLSALNAQDRRLIHLALKENPNVTTQSEGDGLFRQLLIIPKNLEERTLRDERRRGEKGYKGRQR